MAFPYQQAMNMAKRMMNPYMAGKADDLVNETMELGLKAGDDILGAKKGGESYAEWLRRREDVMQPTYQRIVDDFHTPELVLGRDPNGQAIIDSATRWDLEKNRTMEPLMRRYLDATKLIGKGSKDDELVFEALENPTLAGALKPRARSLYELLKGQFDYTAQERIKRLAGDTESANKIFRLASKGNIAEAELAGMTANQLDALDFAKRLRTNYAPHVFDRHRLMELFGQKVQKFGILRDKEKASFRKTWYDKQIAEYEDSIRKLAGGDPLTWETLPKDFAFSHQMVRHGEDSFVKSARQSFESYIHNWGNAVFDNEAVKEMTLAYDALIKTSPQLAPYAKWFIREFAGYNTKTAWDKIAGTMASFQYIRTLGFNLRSPVMNLTQGVNTMIDANPVWSMKGYMNMWTPKIKQLWDKTGLSTEIPHAFSAEANPYMTRMERVKRVAGFMFNAAEGFNRKHAFSTYFIKATEKMGMAEEDAIQYAIKGVHKTQFQYGRVGMPKALRTPLGRTAGQFTSFSIKQSEFLWNQLKEDPKKAITYVAGTWLGNHYIGNLLGVDLSNALGFPINLGEVVEMISSVSKGEINEALAHSKMLFEGGTGILPASVGGPTWGSLKEIGAAFEKGDAAHLAYAVMPVQLERAVDFLRTIRDKMATGKWQRLNREGSEVLAETNPLEATMNAFGPKPAAITKQSNQWYKQQVFDKLETARKRTISDLIVKGNTKAAERLIERYGLIPSPEMLQEAMTKKILPRDLRKKWIQSSMRQQRREETDEQ